MEELNKLIKKWQWVLPENAKEDIKQFVLSELKALKEECVGEEDNINDPDLTNGTRAESFGYNQKREEIIKAFAKRGV